MRWFGVPKGRLAAPCLFGGLRPFEAARLSWEQVNLGNQEIRLRGQQAKTGKGRTVEICPTLKAWLSRYKGLMTSTGRHSIWSCAICALPLAMENRRRRIRA